MAFKRTMCQKTWWVDCEREDNRWALYLGDKGQTGLFYGHYPTLVATLKAIKQQKTGCSVWDAITPDSIPANIMNIKAWQEGPLPFGFGQYGPTV